MCTFNYRAGTVCTFNYWAGMVFTFDYRVGIRVHFWLQVGTVCNFDYQLDQMSANGFHEELKLILNTYIIKTRSIHIYNCVIARHHGLQYPRAVMHLHHSMSKIERVYLTFGR